MKFHSYSVVGRAVRSFHCYCAGTVWRDCGKPRETCQDSRNLADIRTQHLPNASLVLPVEDPALQAGCRNPCVGPPEQSDVKQLRDSWLANWRVINFLQSRPPFAKQCAILHPCHKQITEMTLLKERCFHIRALRVAIGSSAKRSCQHGNSDVDSK
jgi:hypothetical protein